MLPIGIDRDGLARSPDRLAPAMIPVTEGKYTARSEKTLLRLAVKAQLLAKLYALSPVRNSYPLTNLS